MQVKSLFRKRVVIVDDSRTIQALLTSVFDASNEFKVVGVASDAESAVSMIGKLRPDVVTIDLCMPYIDGAALLEMLGDLGGVCKIVVSDHAANNVGMVSKLRSLGAAACIAKAELSASPTAFLKKLLSVLATFETPGTFTRSLPSHDYARLAKPGSGRVAFGFPVPADERERIAYVHRKQLANATPERQFDLMTRYFARLTSFPVCLMTFIDRDTQWLKSCYGFPKTSTPRCEAFCNYTICQDETFVVRNAANDERFETYPSVTGDPYVRTYVGHPIIADGIHVGAMCIMDTRVRVVSDILVARLRDVAEIAAEMINSRPAMAA